MKPQPAPESVTRMEPARLEDATGAIADVTADLAAASAKLGHGLHPRTAASLASLVRTMNSYYSNLIEGNKTLPKDIERALAGEFDVDEGRRNLQLEAAAHVRVQAAVDAMAAENRLPPPASTEFIRWLHRAFYRDAPKASMRIRGRDREIDMAPGEWRSQPAQDVTVGRHMPPASGRVDDFMRHFESRYRLDDMGTAARLMAMAAAHHRFNFIHPFPDGNGRVSRLMSHAMGLASGIGAHGLWSVSRGLARGLESRSDYKRMMDHADMPRQGDLDGRGNLSQRALADFVLWYLRVCHDQVTYMSSLFELGALGQRMHAFVAQMPSLKFEAALLLDEAVIRGEIARGDAARITGLPERSARRVFSDVAALGLLASDTPKGPVSLRFPADCVETLFPRLFPAS
jgi:Fic family protein